MAKSLEGRSALITGGGQGIGQGIARALAAEGADVMIAQRTLETVEAEADHLRQTYGVKAVARKVNVRERAEVDAMVAAAEAEFGKIDILVNNAGGSFLRRVENHSDEDMQRSMQLNYWSAFWAMRAAFPMMKARGYGRIINLGSLNGVNAHMFTLAYNASKEALRALTRTAAVEWGKHGITANVICPSALSPAARDYFDSDPALAQSILEKVPVGRFGDSAGDIGPVAVFLASEGSSYMTGNTLYVDGGGHINGVPWRPDMDD